MTGLSAQLHPWQPLSALAAPSFDAAALAWAEARTAHAALRAIRAGDLDHLVSVEWSLAMAALDAHLGPQAARRCFDAEPHTWVDLLEPQITKGLARLLSAGGSKLRAARTLALLKTLSPRGPAPSAVHDISLEQISRACVIAEALCANGRRIDVIAWIQTFNGKRFGAVIEAKVGHHLTKGQLKCYEKAAKEKPYRLNPANTSFVIVGPSLTKKTAEQLRPPSCWSFLPWRLFLVRLTSELKIAECDNHDFMRFCRTVWSRAA